MTCLSVNINKVATLRNARGGNIPDVQIFARRCEQSGADGITVHPRPDQRHITHRDVLLLKDIVTTELNIEGNPQPEFLQLVLEAHPRQVTLVPDAAEQLTSNHGYDTIREHDFLLPIVRRLQSEGIRVSLFINPEAEMVEGAKRLGADRVELYTGPYAELYEVNKNEAVRLYESAAYKAKELKIGLNAGHDLNMNNLAPFHKAFPWIAEVSIGQALIADALYYGIDKTIQMYKQQLV